MGQLLGLMLVGAAILAVVTSQLGDAAAYAIGAIVLAAVIVLGVIAAYPPRR